MNYLVTGANRGIGLEFVKQLVARGDNVIATARSPEQAEELQILAETSGVKILELDVANPRTLTELQGFLGSQTLDVVINNAAIYPSSGSLGSLDYDALRTGFEINTIGPLRVIEAVLPALKRSKHAKIINITSKMGSIAENTSGGSYGYRMSKAALNMATKSMALDLEHLGMVAVVMHPGWVQTRMGGPNALIDTQTSVTHMLEKIDTLAPDDNGLFWEWNGKRIPW